VEGPGDRVHNQGSPVRLGQRKAHPSKDASDSISESLHLVVITILMVSSATMCTSIGRGKGEEYRRKQAPVCASVKLRIPT
jgi:hypothetical protein